MPIGTASAKLRKSILFSILKKFSLNYCYQCSAEIAKEEELSIEHKIPYLDSENPVKLFFDLENIAFSHLKCNIGASRKMLPQTIHGTASSYSKRKCRCRICRDYKRDALREFRSK